MCVLNICSRRQWHPTPVLLPGKSHARRSLVGCSPRGREESDTIEWLSFHVHALEKEMATHSSVLAWRIPRTGESGGLPSMGSHRVGHDWSDLAAAVSFWHLTYDICVAQTFWLFGRKLNPSFSSGLGFLWNTFLDPKLIFKFTHVLF